MFLDGLLKKNGRKCKQSELKTGGEMEVNEVEVSEVVGVVKYSKPEAGTEGQDKDVFWKKWTGAFG